MLKGFFHLERLGFLYFPPLSKLLTSTDWRSGSGPLSWLKVAILPVNQALYVVPAFKQAADDKKWKARSSTGRISLIWARGCSNQTIGNNWSIQKQSEMTSVDCLLNQMINAEDYQVNLNCHMFTHWQRNGMKPDWEQHKLTEYPRNYTILTWLKFIRVDYKSER